MMMTLCSNSSTTIRHFMLLQEQSFVSNNYLTDASDKTHKDKLDDLLRHL